MSFTTFWVASALTLDPLMATDVIFANALAPAASGPEARRH
jgi:hypothetical protein